MSKLIALDNGHGLKTPGKRTPMFPDGTKSPYTGESFMHEWEFNRATVQLLRDELERCGFRVIEVSPTEADTSISARCRAANNAGADFLLSVHANALTGQWGTARGIETLSSGSGESLRIGKLLQAALVDATGLFDRGMKDGAWLGVVKGASMPTALVECAFMDNLHEAKLLLTESYRELCAVAMAKALCSAYGMSYVPKARKPKEDEPMNAAEQQAFAAMEKKVDGLVKSLEAFTKPIPAPDWFVKEFSADGVLAHITDPYKPRVFWETLAVTLRTQGKGSGRK